VLRLKFDGKYTFTDQRPPATAAAEVELYTIGMLSVIAVPTTRLEASAQHAACAGYSASAVVTFSALAESG
jgi:hypothetical protein